MRGYNHYKNWEKAMWHIIRNAQKTDKQNLESLYNKLEAFYRKSSEMKNGDHILIPLEDETYLKQTFYKTYSVLDLIDTDGETTLGNLISEQESIAKKYKTIRIYLMNQKNMNIAIGYHCPQIFRNLLNWAKKGDTFVSADNTKYTLVGRAGSIAEFEKTNIGKKSSLQDFTQSRVIKLDLRKSIFTNTVFLFETNICRRKRTISGCFSRAN